MTMHHVGERLDRRHVPVGFLKDGALRRRRQNQVGLDVGNVPERLQGADTVHGSGRAGDPNDEFSHAIPPKSFCIWLTHLPQALSYSPDISLRRRILPTGDLGTAFTNTYSRGRL